MFEDPEKFDSNRDGKAPVSRSPVALLARAPLALIDMLCSRHPCDAAVWIRSMFQRSRPISFALPWLTFDAIRALRRHAKPGMRIFQFGAGHSTIFWSNLGLEVHAVEDDRNWYGMLAKRMHGRPDAYVYLEEDCERYISKLAGIGWFFDNVVIDGSHRKACVAAALAHVKSGRLLVVDNTDWHWSGSIDRLVPEEWVKMVYPGWTPFIGHRSQTTIWYRPDSNDFS